MTADEAILRIGELSKRSGVSPELLRAWEQPYGLIKPTRWPGGLRLYSTADLERVRLMRQHLANGLAAAQAARPESLARWWATGGSRRRPSTLPRRATSARTHARRLRRAARPGADRPPAGRRHDRHAPERGGRCPTCTSSACAGSAARRQSRRSTSPRACCAAGCSVSRAVGAREAVPPHCLPAFRASGTTSA